MGTRRVVGCMTGTSIDGLDAALVEIDGAGLEMRARVVRCLSRPLGEVGTTLRLLAEQRPMIASEIAAAMFAFAMLHAVTVSELLSGESCDLICVHGQTVFHRPPLSWQLMQPAPIVEALHCPVVYDLRQADLAGGGEGAPITPIADWVLFRGASPLTAVVNLGGYCNVTLLPGDKGDAEKPTDSLRACDVCACNQLLDEISRRLLYAPFDEDGRHAMAGSVNEEALIDLDGILSAQSGSKRSLGTGDEVAEWISRFRARVSPQDLAATACESIAGSIAASVKGAEKLLLAGGGVRNQGLVRAIRSAAAASVDSTEVRGVPPMYREAACFAVLGALCQDRVPITLPQVTGVSRPPLSGAWVYP